MARKVAAELAETAGERDRAGERPHGVVARLKESGLLALRVPTDQGGAGESWAVAASVVRAVGAADASIGHLLGYHYLQLWRVSLCPDPDLRERLTRRSVEGRWFWAGASNPRDDPLRLSEEGDSGLTLSGRKGFATGAGVADHLVVTAVRDDTGASVTFALDAAAPGIEHLDDWDNLGQRASASGTVVFHGTPVDPANVLRERAADAPEASGRQSLPQIGFQLVLTHLLVALAEGALDAAADYVRTRTRPWPASGVEHATEDPYILATLGELVSRTAAAGALADRATAAFAAADDAGPDLDDAQRGAAALEIARAKVAATGVATDVTARIFELTGARATATKHGLDRYWRDARTLTLHDPVAHKAREVGDHHLTGALPPITGYS